MIMSEINEYCIAEGNKYFVSDKFLILMKIILQFVF